MLVPRQAKEVPDVHHVVSLAVAENPPVPLTATRHDWVDRGTLIINVCVTREHVRPECRQKAEHRHASCNVLEYRDPGVREIREMKYIGVDESSVSKKEQENDNDCRDTAMNQSFVVMIESQQLVHGWRNAMIATLGSGHRNVEHA